MSDLRNKLIRLAHQNPALRADLLPLLKQAARDEVTHYIVTTYLDDKGKEKTSKDSWLSSFGKPTKANFEKIVSKGFEDKSEGTPTEAKLVFRGETLFTSKPKTASIKQVKEANYHPLNIRDRKIKFAYTKVNDGIVELVAAIEKNSDISPDYDLEKAMLKLSSAFNDVHVALATYAIDE